MKALQQSSDDNTQIPESPGIMPPRGFSDGLLGKLRK
jgi:hypothetical protein